MYFIFLFKGLNTKLTAFIKYTYLRTYHNWIEWDILELHTYYVYLTFKKSTSVLKIHRKNLPDNWTVWWEPKSVEILETIRSCWYFPDETFWTLIIHPFPFRHVGVLSVANSELFQIKFILSFIHGKICADNSFKIIVINIKIHTFDCIRELEDDK